MPRPINPISVSPFNSSSFFGNVMVPVDNTDLMNGSSVANPVQTELNLLYTLFQGSIQGAIVEKPMIWCDDGTSTGGTNIAIGQSQYIINNKLYQLNTPVSVSYNTWDQSIVGTPFIVGQPVYCYATASVAGQLGFTLTNDIPAFNGKTRANDPTQLFVFSATAFATNTFLRFNKIQNKTTFTDVAGQINILNVNPIPNTSWNQVSIGYSTIVGQVGGTTVPFDCKEIIVQNNFTYTHQPFFGAPVAGGLQQFLYFNTLPQNGAYTRFITTQMTTAPEITIDAGVVANYCVTQSITAAVFDATALSSGSATWTDNSTFNLPLTEQQTFVYSSNAAQGKLQLYVLGYLSP